MFELKQCATYDDLHFELHNSAHLEVIHALTTVVLIDKAKRLLPVVRDEIGRLEKSLPELEAAIEDARKQQAEREDAYHEALLRFTELRDKIPQGLSQEQWGAFNHWQVELDKRRDAKVAGESQVSSAERKLAEARERLERLRFFAQELEAEQLSESERKVLQVLSKALK